jgi:DHA1 family inner membrane transport protein
MGLTVANVGGVPAATWIGQQVGWRMTFAGTAVLGLVTIGALWLALPKGEPGTRPDVRRELSVLTSREVLMAMGTTVLGSGAMFALYTYIAPMLAEITHASPGFVALALVLIGIGFTLGNSLGGRLADWSLDGATKLILASLAVVMVLLPLLLKTHVGAAIGLLVWGAAAFGIVPPVQMRVMHAAAGAPGLASSVNVGAFNLGNALGAALGGMVIGHGLGYAAVPFVGAALAAGGLVLVWIGNAGRRPDAASASI